MDDLINRADAVKTVIRMCSPICEWQDGTQQYPDCVVAEINTLPSDAVDCTDFIEWLVDRVLDETIWEYNSVAYGEIICRKLEKLGVLEVTEEPSYYIRPSADAVQGWIPCSERLPEVGEICLLTVHEYGWNCKEYTRVIIGEYSDNYADHILAWMPLPKPYREESEVEE